MATGIVREYIGARYVPKFFENENGTPEWAPNVQYEPLTIVTYNMNSYTSKKPVPASVGNPSDNPTYWASTGNYNAQVEAYRQEVVQFKNDILEQIGTVSPMDYGAVGDGIADDSAAVQAAGADGVVFDPDHVYYIGENIILVYGAKDTEFYLEKDAAIESVSGKAMYTGCKFRKNPAELADGTRGKWSLVVRNQKPINVSHNEFYNAVSALYVQNCSGIIEGNYFHDIIQTAATSGGNGYGILLIGCDGISICGNLFKDVARHEIYISIDDTPSVRCRNINIHDNVFKRTSAVQGSTTGFETSIQLRPCVNVNIHHNTFDGIQSVFTTYMQITGDAAYAVGCENITVDYNIIHAQKNTARAADGAFVLIGHLEDYSGYTAENVSITNNLFCEIPAVAFNAIGRVQSVNNFYFANNKFIDCEITYGFNITDVSDQNNPHNIIVENNDIGPLSGTMFRFAGSGRNFGIFRVCDNRIKTAVLMEFQNGTEFDEFTFKNNVIEGDATYSTLYTRSATLRKVTISGNSSNVKYGWSVTVANDQWYDYDNTFSPLTAGTYANMKRGAVLALADNTIGIVQYNGALRIIS